MAAHFTAWDAHTMSIGEILADQPLDADVWVGPDGSLIIGDTTASEDEGPVEYVLQGTVAEWLEDTRSNDGY